MKRLTSLILILLMAALTIFPAQPARAAEVDELESAIAVCGRNMAAAHEMADSARFLGYPEDHFIIKEAQAKYASESAKAKELRLRLEEARKPQYTQEELDLLSRIIYAEAGCTWIPDWVQQMVGSVVLNRVASSVYPNTIREVIYQPGQYGPVYNGSLWNTPDARTVANAKYLLEHGSVCPQNVTGQSGSITGGGVYSSYYDSILGSTIYFCYT